MKSRISIFYAGLLSFFFLVSCQRDHSTEEKAVDNKGAVAPSPERTTTTCNPNAYIITLESHVLVGTNWEWTWSVQNSNPGNGNNGTIQDLSNWGMQLGSCVNPASIIAGSFSNDGITWKSFTPSYVPDQSQG